MAARRILRPTCSRPALELKRAIDLCEYRAQSHG
jgi:hypothetical protein